MSSPNIYNLRSWSIFLAVIVLIASCKNEDDEMPDPGAINITSTAVSFSDSRGNTVDIPLTLKANDGIKALTVSIDGGTADNIPVTEGSTEEDVTINFTIPAETQLGTEFSMDFTLTDQATGSANLSVTVVTGVVIDRPTTYNFERDGASTVSRSGQTERLDMVEEIKNLILKEGDKGNIISEQALLDAYENKDGNGGGLFSFSSTKQLKNKTFAPDLDANLFEDLFARAAAASVAANGGAMASNGTAGLIVRENSGNTILVDENGREFTQLIEKGLMGAVFYNQIFNVYLSEDRTGDEVENVELSEGKNYTAMEHHWDEAFGYFDPPLDFTSPWPDDRASEDRFWSHYSNTVDNVANGLLGTNKIIMDAYIDGRTAIVNQDFATKNSSKTVLYEGLELVAAATAVHYINLTLGYLNEGKTGEAFHTLSEAWAFTNALRYSPNRKIDLATIEQIMETDFGANGNFWNVTPEGLNAAKATLVNSYSDLEPVKDDL